MLEYLLFLRRSELRLRKGAVSLATGESSRRACSTHTHSQALVAPRRVRRVVTRGYSVIGDATLSSSEPGLEQLVVAGKGRSSPVGVGTGAVGVVIFGDSKGTRARSLFTFRVLDL